jgi:hypothetical protein
MKPVVRSVRGRCPEVRRFSTKAPPPTDGPVDKNNPPGETPFNAHSLGELTFGLPAVQERRNRNDLDLFVF